MDGAIDRKVSNHDRDASRQRRFDVVMPVFRGPSLNVSVVIC
jgi:hypothetical protein